MYRYSRDHVWVLAEGRNARIGLSDFAQRELGDVAYVELPEKGRVLSRGETLCSLDSLKSASEIYAPVSGTVREVNAALSGDGGSLVNTDPLGRGWIAILELSDPRELDALLSEQQYKEYIRGL